MWLHEGVFHVNQNVDQAMQDAQAVLRKVSCFLHHATSSAPTAVQFRSRPSRTVHGNKFRKSGRCRRTWEIQAAVVTKTRPILQAPRGAARSHPLHSSCWRQLDAVGISVQTRRRGSSWRSSTVSLRLADCSCSQWRSAWGLLRVTSSLLST